MENESRFQQWINSLSDSIGEQEWFRELKGKWEELDPQSQLYLKVASGVLSLSLVLLLSISSIWRVHRLKVELAEKSELLLMIRNANTELRTLRESTPTAATSSALSGASAEPWPIYFTNTANVSGLGKESLSISDEKKGTSTDLAKESLFDLSLKHVNIRQVVRYAFSLENGQRLVKLRNLAIDTKGDPTGYLDATFSVSALALQPGK